MDQPSSTESNALTLRIRFKSASLEEFIGRYAVDVSPGGIFIRTRQPVEVGTTLQFEFSLADGSSLLAGLGTVAWVRENDPSRSNNAPGMGLRFDKLTPESQQTHQTILAEKSRREGKPQATPYPPTAFVVPTRQSPVPEAVRATAESVAASDSLAKLDASSANFAKTLPAPAAALAARVQEAAASEIDEFDSGGKTEISDKPVDFFIKEAEAAQKAVPNEEFSPKAPLEDWRTDAHDVITAAGPPPAPEEVAVSDSQSYATEAPTAAGSQSLADERPVGPKQSFASLLDLGDSGESRAAGLAPTLDLSAGVPVEVSTSEKTEEVSLGGGKLDEEALDLGTTGDEVERVPSLAEIEAATVAPRPKRSPVVAIVAIVLAMAAAFVAVYLLQTKPWQTPGGGEAQVIVVKKQPAVTPTPAPPPAAAPDEKAAAPAAKEPTAAEALAAKKAAAAEEKAAADRAAAEKRAAEKAAAADKAAAERAAAEKAAAEKAAAGKPAGKPEAVAAKPAGKPSPKPSPKSAGEPADGEKPAAASEAEEVYRLAFRSSPIGAEVLIDGEYYSRTPCDRRILDPKKLVAVTIRKQGYEQFEHLVGPSDNWIKKGSERVLTVTVALKKAKPGAAPAAAPAPEGAAPEPAVAPPTEPPKTAPKPAAEEPEPYKE